MSVFTHQKGFQLTVYSNKNASCFKRAAKQVSETQECILDKNMKAGFIYDDFDADWNMKKKWKETHGNDMRVYTIAPRRKTLHMDDKVFFGTYTQSSTYVPKAYLKIEHLNGTPDDRILFVKPRGSTGGRGVVLKTFKEIKDQKIDPKIYLIQEYISCPHLYDGRRYKIRSHIVLHNKNVYLHERSWFSTSSRTFVGDIHGLDEKYITEMNIIHQTPQTKFYELKDIHGYKTIMENIKKSCSAFKSDFHDDISKIDYYEFAVLGVDYVVDSALNVYMIEANHRSNYGHPAHIVENVDVPVLADIIRLAINQNNQNTELHLIA